MRVRCGCGRGRGGWCPAIVLRLSVRLSAGLSRVGWAWILECPCSFVRGVTNSC